MPGYRGLSSDRARQVRQAGHDDALEFASLLGLTADYKNDLKAKKDVIDPSGDAHSIKSGNKKWQIFLYGVNRFKSDDAFQVMNGIGEILINCIESFPHNFSDYQKDKTSAKEKLRKSMVALADKLKTKTRLRGFLNKAIFNGGEVNYLTVKHGGIFHIFLNKDVINTLSNNFEIANSQAKSQKQFPEQKVLFKYNGFNVGEIEMRNDTETHYREIRFNMLKNKVMNILFTNITNKQNHNDKIIVYGNALKVFGRWK